MSPVAVNQMLTGKQPQLLATKILPPRSAAGLIDRPRLLGLTAQLEEKQLVVIKAAAGFGKTSLALAWADNLRQSGNSSHGLPSIPTTTSRHDFSST
jgi:LuxR family maltose regulon positive regulatory protein